MMIIPEPDYSRLLGSIMYSDRIHLKFYKKKFRFKSSLVLYALLCLISLLGCSSLKAGRYFNDAQDYSQNIRYQRKALQYYQKAWQNYFETAGEPTIKVEFLYNMANLYFDFQEYENAFRYYNEALKSLEFPEKTPQKIRILNNIGVIHRYLGQYEYALGHFEEALNIIKRAREEKLGDFGKEYHKISLNKAVALEKLGKSQEALEILGKLLANENVKEYQYEIALAKIVCGIIQIEKDSNNIQNNPEHIQKALEYHYDALPVFEESEQKYDQAFVYHNIGLLYTEQAKYKEAKEYYIRSIDLCEEIGDQETAWLTYYNLGNLYNQHSEADKALKSYQQSIDIIESIWSRLKIDDFKTSFLQDKIDVYKRIIELLWRNGHHEEAFNYLERAKSKALVDLLGNQKIRGWEGINEDLLHEKERIDDKIREILQKLNEEYSKPSEKRKRVGRLTATLKQERQEYQKLLHEIQVKNPEYASFISVNPLTLPEIQSLIPDDSTALLEYLILEDRTLIFILTSHELYVETIEVPQKKLQGTVLAFRIDIEREMPGWREKSQWLYSQLITPVEQYLDGIDTLCIIPYGILHYLPFGALLNTSTNQFLLEYPYNLFYAPSANVLKFAFDKGNQRLHTLLDRNTTQNLLLIFANPEDNIEYAEEEANEIQKLYPQQSTLFRGSEASEGKVKEVAGTAQILHFATHGILDPVQPLFSGLVLADNTVLEVHEIFNELFLDNNNMVILSACNTALGRRTEGDEVIGLTRALLYAGTSSIVASLWAVDDQSTALIMQRFHEHLKTEAITKANALKQAQISLLHDDMRSEFHHPYYWAAFELIGDYR